ncbi:MAG TPA: class I SAM-dependent methyltransferase [Thermoplasmata archaeon]|nr:class I SAM-dependent methyltransferase [Thermoplasmata archaeon]
MAEANGWEEIAAYYDEKQGDRGDTWHRTLIDPGLWKRVGRVRGLRVLDLACGNGYIARRLARSGAHVVAIDSSPSMLERAKARTAPSLDVRYERRDAAHLTGFPDDSFDLAVSNMALMDISDGAGAIRQVARVLRPGGRFVATLSHPCFDNGSASAWSVERVLLTTTVYRKISRYRELLSERFPWRTPDGTLYRTLGHHRPLNWYARVLGEAGLAITALDEPEALPEFRTASPVDSWIAQIPLHLVIQAHKCDMGEVARRRAAISAGPRAFRRSPRGERAPAKRGNMRRRGASRP